MERATAPPAEPLLYKPLIICYVNEFCGEKRKGRERERERERERDLNGGWFHIMAPLAQCIASSANPGSPPSWNSRQ